MKEQLQQYMNQGYEWIYKSRKTGAVILFKTEPKFFLFRVGEKKPFIIERCIGNKEDLIVDLDITYLTEPLLIESYINTYQC